MRLIFDYKVSLTLRLLHGISGALLRAKRGQRSSMGNKFWLSMRPRNWVSGLWQNCLSPCPSLTLGGTCKFIRSVESLWSSVQDEVYLWVVALLGACDVTNNGRHRGFYRELVRQRLEFTPLCYRLLVYGESWNTSERHFLKNPTRASLLALAKSVYYLLAWSFWWSLFGDTFHMPVPFM